MANHDSDHKPGSMNIREQEKTFAGFIRLSMIVGCVAIGILIFMALVNS